MEDYARPKLMRDWVGLTVVNKRELRTNGGIIMPAMTRFEVVGVYRGLKLQTTRSCPANCPECGVSHRHSISKVRPEELEIVVDNPHLIIAQRDAIQKAVGGYALYGLFEGTDPSHRSHRRVYTMTGTPQAADALAEALAREVPTARRGYITYLFEALDNLLPEDEFERLLRDTIRELVGRRERGCW